tara:strand:+ start:11358 stop:12143 length:786 start_codon:yes stop_codon:yes gene_type:complete
MILEGWKKFKETTQRQKPRVYYHVTGAGNEEGIKAQGIHGSTKAGDRDYAYSGEDAKEKRVYLFSSQDSAFMAAFSRPDSGIFGGAQPPFIFVKVNIAKIKPAPEVHDDLELPDFDAYYLIGDVPPHAIVEIESEASVTDKLEDEDNYYDDDEVYDLLNEAPKDDGLRVFEVELVVKIKRQVNDDTLADIRSIPGVTIVSSLRSQKSGGGIISTIKVKFHPSKEAMTGQTYVKQVLIPTINSREIPNCIVMRYTARSLKQI